MPTVMKVGPHRYFFYSGDRDEPKHIHVERDNKLAKFWLEPIRIHNPDGFNHAEIMRICRTIEQNHQAFVEAWNDYFSS